MGFEMDEDILQDFLVEAGEILDLLSEQLVDLEKNPQDNELLNAIFRGFHTVKGGAGFLCLTELVETCHGAENVFDNLRNHGRILNAELMDVILQALDTINEQFNCVKQRQDMPAAAPAILEAGRLAHGADHGVEAGAVAAAGQDADRLDIVAHVGFPRVPGVARRRDRDSLKSVRD